MILDSLRVALTLAALAALGVSTASADDAAPVALSIQNHKFSPEQPTAPAGKPLEIQLTNADATPAEFESKPMRVEKVVPAGGKVVIKVRALPPGRYRFFDDYHEDAAVGFLVVK